MFSYPNRASARDLLVTDVDNTLIGDNASLEHFVRYVELTPSFRYVLNSSRPIASVVRTLDDLPVTLQPAGIIGAMGTEILVGDRLDEAWGRRFETWDRTIIDQIMLRLGAAAHAAEYQTPFKASFTVPRGRQPEAIAAIRESGQPSRIVFSGAADFDVLPEGAGKGAATLRCAELLGFSHDDLVVAGDSANDLDLFEVSSKGILVGNARDELRRRIGGATVYEATKPFAAGVIEGLTHWGILPLERNPN